MVLAEGTLRYITLFKNSLIQKPCLQFIQQPGKIKVNDGNLEVQVDRLPIEIHAKNVDQLINELYKQNLLVTPFGIEIMMHQAVKQNSLHNELLEI